MNNFKLSLNLLIFMSLIVIASCSDSPSNTEPEELGEISITNISNGDILSGEVDLNLSINAADELNQIIIKVRGNKIASLQPNESNFSLTTWEFANGNAEVKLEAITTNGDLISSTTNAVFENYLFKWQVGNFVNDLTDNPLDDQVYLIASKPNGELIGIEEITSKSHEWVGIGAPEEFDFNLPSYFNLTLMHTWYYSNNSDYKYLKLQSVTGNEIWTEINQDELGGFPSVSKFNDSYQEDLRTIENNEDNIYIMEPFPSVNSNSEHEGGVNVIVENIEGSGSNWFLVYVGKGDQNSGYEYFQFNENNDLYDYELNIDVANHSSDILIEHKLSSSFYFIENAIKDSTYTIDYNDDRIGTVESSLLIPNNLNFIFNGIYVRYGENRYVYSLTNFITDRTTNIPRVKHFTPTNAEVEEHIVQLYDELNSNSETTIYYEQRSIGNIINELDLIDVKYELINIDNEHYNIFNEGDADIYRYNNYYAGETYTSQWEVFSSSDIHEFAYPNISDFLSDIAPQFEWSDLNLTNLEYYKQLNSDENIILLKQFLMYQGLSTENTSSMSIRF
ncbi:hypothetical protein [Rhodohalobacter barkolensis]|uniref:Uncharacterized protein n=1 Tax=Rhodohalobacter barkolensis TaxID=2053187 RepID=A0A2N0VGZ2_9BACT|nr:hypothetical protein [Rhodohalobacter barkolensis]PKD43472.1 hypothetical protein CWD77_07830 [Rhodohalobacter barkolensis]